MQDRGTLWRRRSNEGRKVNGWIRRASRKMIVNMEKYGKRERE